MKKTLVRILSVLLILAFVPMTVLAEDWDLSDGSITVSAVAKPEGGTKQTVSQDRSTGKVSKEDAAPVIKSSGETSNTVTIDAGKDATANVTIKNATIKSDGDAAVKITGQGDVSLNIEGKNSAESGGGHAGVEKTNAGNLTVGSDSGAGELTAKGGADGGAGIGSGSFQNVSNITITGGKIEAVGAGGGAGIGSGVAADDSSNITITGDAKVKASGVGGGAGIGGGHQANGSNITISGNAEVAAIGGNSAAGIGGGRYSAGSNITITGDAKVKASSVDGGAGIGGGGQGDGSDITISGNAEVAAIGGTDGAGIGGGGRSGTGSNITVADSARVKVSGGKAESWSGRELGTGAAIGSGGDFGGVNGAETAPDTTGLKPNGRIEYYEPGADFEKDKPTRIISGRTSASGEDTETRAEALYWVTDLAGKSISSQAERKDGVLTLTVEAGGAVLTGTLRGLKTLQAQGVEKITFTDGTYTATVVLAELIARGNPGDTYVLTLGAEISLTLNGEEIALA